jgi:hypothetical protein
MHCDGYLTSGTRILSNVEVLEAFTVENELLRQPCSWQCCGSIYIESGFGCRFSGTGLHCENLYIFMFLDLPDPDPLVRGTDPDPSFLKGVELTEIVIGK